MSDTAEKCAWIKRVLGIDLPNAGARDLAARRAALDRAVSAWPVRPGSDLSRSLRLAAGEAAFLEAQGDEGSGQALLDRATALMHETGFRAALAAWHSARVAAFGTLSGLAAELRASNTSGREVAAAMLEEAGTRLDERPETPGAVELMLRLIETDAVLAASEAPNVFGMKVSVREPLAAALAFLRVNLIAQQGPG